MLEKRSSLICLVAVLITGAVLWPSPAQAHSFTVSPAEINIDNLTPGQEAEFELTIRNDDDITHRFTFAAYHPEQKDRREGRAEFPDDDWISFSPQRPEIPPNSSSTVKVQVAIPPDSKWANKDWEIWLGVTPESSNLLAVKLYVRLLVSTGGNVYANPRANLPIWAIVIALVILVLSFYYFRVRKRQEKRSQS